MDEETGWERLGVPQSKRTERRVCVGLCLCIRVRRSRLWKEVEGGSVEFEEVCQEK